MIEEADKNWPQFLARLERIRTAIVSRDRMLINLTGDERTLAGARSQLTAFVDSIPVRPNTHNFLQQWSPSLLRSRQNEGLIVPTQVNYVVRSGSLYNAGEEVTGATSVVSRYLSRGFLWDNVRVIGGAYGGSCSFSATSGRFTYSSYRDPNLVNTLNIYRSAADHLHQASITSEDLEQAIVGAIGDLDAPLSPDQKGFASLTRYIVGRNDADRQQWREEVMATSFG